MFNGEGGFLVKIRTILDTIDGTPHVLLNRLFQHRDVQIWMKLKPSKQKKYGSFDLSKYKNRILSKPSEYMNSKNHSTNNIKEVKNNFMEEIDYIITGVGTGGHITACTLLKEEMSNLKVIAVEPEDTPIINRDPPNSRAIQRIGSGFIRSTLKTDLLDDIIQVNEQESFDYAMRCAKEEGLFVGISTGAVLAAINKRLPQIKDGSKILTFSFDTGERHSSVASLHDIH